MEEVESYTVEKYKNNGFELFGKKYGNLYRNTPHSFLVLKVFDFILLLFYLYINVI